MPRLVPALKVGKIYSEPGTRRSLSSRGRREEEVVEDEVEEGGEKSGGERGSTRGRLARRYIE